MSKMRNAAIILDESLTTVKVRFDGASQGYTFLCPKTIARYLKPDDAVLAGKINGSIVVVWVMSVDEETEIQLDDPLTYCFVFQTVDRDYLEALKIRLNDEEKKLKDQQRQKLRDQVRNELILEYKSEEAEIL